MFLNYKISKTDLSQLCRCCMKEVASWEKENFSPRAVEMFCFCTDIKIEDDILPRQFCYDCTIRMESSYTFILEAQRIDMHYKTMLTELNTSAIIENDPYNKNPAFLGYQPNYHQAQINNSPYFKEILENNHNTMDNLDIPSDMLENDLDYSMTSDLEFIKENESLNNEMEVEKECKKDSKERKGEKKKKCPKCPKTFAAKTWFVKHMKNEHEKKDNRHICPQCSKCFAKRPLLMQHIALHSSERLHSCEVCGKSYKLRKHLTIHMKTHSDLRPFICDTCQMCFKLKSILRNHMRIHQVKQHLCPECGISFVHLGNLSIHMRSHSGLKPHMCSDCDFRSSTTSSLARHRLRHTGHKPFVCVSCQKRFTDSSALARHSRTHTGELPYRCPHCPLAFLDSWKRKTHLMRTHRLQLHEIPKMAKDGAIINK